MTSLPSTPSAAAGVAATTAEQACTPDRLAGAFAMSVLDDAYGPQAAPAGAAADGWAGGFVAPLTDHGMLSVAGEDAAKFLHGQLTNDVEHLTPEQARWYGYCTAKGRMLGSFLGWRDEAAIRLVTTRALAEPLRKRLAMFVLRAKAKVTDASQEFALLGLGGEAAAPALGELGIAAPQPMHCASAGGVTAIGLPGVDVDGSAIARWMLVVPAPALDSVANTLRARLVPVGSALWRWTEVLAGVARVVPATSELFVPQMLNYELVGGVSFTKGCYPGQEVVARSHYLGKLKRRMFAGHTDAEPPAAAADVHDASGGEACGQVVMAAPAPGGGADLIFECRIDSARAGGLRVGEAAIELATLPYPFPA